MAILEKKAYGCALYTDATQYRQVKWKPYGNAAVIAGSKPGVFSKPALKDLDAR
jgi:hypothetical protein